MKTLRFAAVAAWIVSLVGGAVAQVPATAASNSELTALVARVQDKLRAGERTADKLAEELRAFDTLREKYAEKDPAFAAKITEMEYTLCRDVLRASGKAAELRALLAGKYRDHLRGSRLAQEFAMEDRMEQARAAQAALIGKPAPELNITWSTQPALKKLSDLKGKVVVLDFWATWCGPCIATFPQIWELAAHYKNSDVLVLGVTSLQGNVANLESTPIDTKGNPEKEYALMSDFIKAKDMTWTVVFTEQRVFNPEFSVMGIPHMAIIAPDGTVRANGLHPSMPHTEKVAKIDAILREFGKATGSNTRTGE